MTFELDPKIVRLTPFNGDGGALAAVQVAFGPIHVRTRLFKGASGGYFLSMPSRHSEANDKWYEQVVISDPGLLLKAQSNAVSEYERVSSGQRVAV